MYGDRLGRLDKEIVTDQVTLRLLYFDRLMDHRCIVRTSVVDVNTLVV